MVTKAKADKSTETIEVMTVMEGQLECYVLGRSPLILNRMPEKAWHSLIFPERKTAASKASNLKHDPFKEFRDSAYRMPNANDATLIAQVGSAFKKALSNAALYMEGVRKTEIGCLTYVPDELVAIYGIPQIFSSIVRSADMNRTPDVRTRLIVPHWAAKVRINFVTPLIKEKTVINLLAAAGLYMGVGDWRPQKGAGAFGQFTLVDADNDTFNSIVENGQRDAQIEAMRDPVAYNDETKELLSWFTGEVTRRGFEGHLEKLSDDVITAPQEQRPSKAIMDAAKKAAKGNGADAH